MLTAQNAAEYYSDIRFCLRQCVLRVGNVCMKELTDITDFMKDIFELGLNEAEECCVGGVSVREGCPCPSVPKRIETTCVFDYCFTWDGLNAEVSKFKGKFLDYTLVEHTIGLFAAIWGFVGSGGSLENANDDFESIMGALIGAISGMILSIWLGVRITDGTITPYYAGNVRSNHYEFRSEPGKGIIGSLLGVFDAFWAIAYMQMAIGLTALPLDNAFHIS